MIIKYIDSIDNIDYYIDNMMENGKMFIVHNQIKNNFIIGNEKTINYLLRKKKIEKILKI